MVDILNEDGVALAKSRTKNKFRTPTVKHYFKPLISGSGFTSKFDDISFEPVTLSIHSHFRHILSLEHNYHHPAVDLPIS